MKRIPILFDNKENCCGCSACSAVCPTQAISMKYDEEGFRYPEIEEDKCIRCEKCLTVCSFKEEQQYKPHPIVYAVKHRNSDIRKLSRSGGMFTALSDAILQENGVIYGCVLTEDFQAKHVRATNEELRNQMRGSKYIESNLCDTFKSVKEDMNAGKSVLFSGTSCQIAGLKSFIGSENERLICIDLVCHGVPSPKVWRDYVKWQEKKAKGKCVAVDFRNKKFGWNTHIETLEFRKKNGETKVVDSKMFTNLFYGHAIVRLSCFICPYKRIEHPGDITIADFWGIDTAAPGFNDNKGVSLVMINTEKGIEVFDAIKDTLHYQSCEIEKGMQGPLIGPFPKPPNREEFWETYKDRSFGHIARKYGEYGIMNTVKKRMLWFKQRCMIRILNFVKRKRFLE